MRKRLVASTVGSPTPERGGGARLLSRDTGRDESDPAGEARPYSIVVRRAWARRRTDMTTRRHTSCCGLPWSAGSSTTMSRSRAI